MIRMRLFSPEGVEIAELLTPFVPSAGDGQTISVAFADDVVRKFWFDGVLRTHFFQDGPSGVISLHRVDVQVNETYESHCRALSLG